MLEIYLDVDGVIYNINKCALDIASKEFGLTLEWEKNDDWWWQGKNMTDTPPPRKYFEKLLNRKGFFLNGRSYPLRGVSRHQDRYNMGWAITRKEHAEDMALIKEVGTNTIRLAHYQHDQYFYDLCDEYGQVIWAEIPYISTHMPTGRENTISQMKELIESDVPVGRKLDFLVQEMNRETNTIGSKCNNLEISNIVINIKNTIIFSIKTPPILEVSEQSPPFPMLPF